jgi:hypothetical protein
MRKEPNNYITYKADMRISIYKIQNLLPNMLDTKLQIIL